MQLAEGNVEPKSVWMILGWPKSSFRYFQWKNQNYLFGQPTVFHLSNNDMLLIDPLLAFLLHSKSFSMAPLFKLSNVLHVPHLEQSQFLIKTFTALRSDFSHLLVFFCPLFFPPPPHTHLPPWFPCWELHMWKSCHLRAFICLTLHNWHLLIPLASTDITSPDRSASHPPTPNCPALPITCHLILFFISPPHSRGSLMAQTDSKESACNAGDLGLIFPGSGRSPGGGNGYPFWYSCLEYPTDRGAWQATVHGVTKSGTGWRTITSPPLQFSKLYYPFVCLSIVSICSWWAGLSLP